MPGLTKVNLNIGLLLLLGGCCVHGYVGIRRIRDTRKLRVHPLKSATRLHRLSPSTAAPTSATPERVEPSLNEAAEDEDPDGPLPAALVPIWLGVFVQMLGEGIAISSLPLHMKSLGATPVMIGAATSCFSVAQMIICPILVAQSGRIGRKKVLRFCLGGAAFANILISLSSSTRGIVAARLLAGVFAASTPVAQAASTDIVPPSQTARALSRVSASTQLGVVVGPMVVAVLAAMYGRLGMATEYTTRAVFATSSAFALGVLLLQHRVDKSTAAVSSAGGKSGQPEAASSSSGEEPAPPAAGTEDSGRTPQATRGTLRLAQPMLRLIALAFGWSLTLSVSTYCLLGSAFLGYSQPQLSATFSAGAAITILTQLVILPRLIKAIGVHAACALGLGMVSSGLAGCAVLWAQPFHTCLYLLNRIGSGVGDTSTATLVSMCSPSPTARARNLGLIQSTRAAARIVTPMLSGKLFEVSCGGARGPRGALPYLTLATLCVTLTPLPLLLRRITSGSFSRGGVACDTRAAPKPTTATNRNAEGSARREGP